MECSGCILVSRFCSSAIENARIGWARCALHLHMGCTGLGKTMLSTSNSISSVAEFPYKPACVLYASSLTKAPSLTPFLPGGGMPTTTNRTIWPTTGGAIAIQPGWFQGHATAFFYINMGFGTDGPTAGPPNMSFPMVPVFQIVGPTKNPYPGTFCLPQVPLPVNQTVKAGDLATIQVVEVAVHGASLYSVSLCISVFPNLSGLA